MKNVKDFFIKNKTLFIIVLLLVIVIGSSWAYFAAQVTGGASANINVTTDIPEEFILNVEKNLNLVVNVETLTEESDNITDTTKATATFKAGTNGDTSKTYNVYFNIEENGYNYTTPDNKPEIILSITGPDGEINDKNIVSKDISYVTATDKDSKEIKGFDITNYQGLIKIAEDYAIETTVGKTVTQDWTFTLTFINLESNQKDNANKTLSSAILLQKEKVEENNVERNKKMLIEKANYMDPVEKGEFLQHTEGLENSASDDGYRYSGNNPDNFICFGPGSKDYNNGTSEATCELTNQYRIIGIVPVTKSDGTKENLVKVIKSEYITASELGLDTSGTLLKVNTSYAKSPRIKTTSGIHNFYWSGSSSNSSNQWSSSTLKAALNETYLNNTLGSTWAKKIEKVKWNVGGVNTCNVTPKVMKENEEKKEMGGTITSTDKIGLMYIHDYGFASAKENWGTNVNAYNNDNINANWLFNGVNEWPISRNSSTNDHAFYINLSEFVGHNTVYGDSRGVRPVFYLKSNIKIIADDNANGTFEKPFRVQ